MIVPRISDQSRSCVTCLYFDFAPDPNTKTGKRLNRECLYKGKIRTVNGKCEMWKDPRSLKQRLKGERIRMKAFTA